MVNTIAIMEAVSLQELMVVVFSYQLIMAVTGHGK